MYHPQPHLYLALPFSLSVSFTLSLTHCLPLLSSPLGNVHTAQQKKKSCVQVQTHTPYWCRWCTREGIYLCVQVVCVHTWTPYHTIFWQVQVITYIHTYILTYMYMHMHIIYYSSMLDEGGSCQFIHMHLVKWTIFMIYDASCMHACHAHIVCPKNELMFLHRDNA